MRTQLLLALLPATCAFAAILPRQDTATSSDTTPTSTATATSTTVPEIPCPTTPANCAAKTNGHLICLNSRTWCLYTDSTRHTPAFFPVDLESPCADCLVNI